MKAVRRLLSMFFVTVIMFVYYLAAPAKTLADSFAQEQGIEAYTDGNDNVTGVTDARGSTVLTQYDAAKRIATQITDARNNSTAYGYDSLNRVNSISSGNTEIGYTYADDKLTTVNVDGAVAYGLTYDGFGRTISTKAGASADSMAALATNAYDGDTGLLTQTQYGNGFTVSYVYDNLDRITEVKYNGTSMYRYVYDGSGNLYSACDAALGFTIYYEYDHTDRCVKSCTKDNATDAIRSSYSYQYDVNNNLIKLTCSTNGTTWATTYTYDKDNRPITATLASGSAITNTYDSIGRLSTKSIGAYTTTLSYLAGINGSQTAMVSSYQNGTDAAYQYEYDANGNITHIQQGDTHLYYQYDALNQLVREDNSILNKSITYTYDDRGNMLNKTEYAYVANGGTLGAAADTITYGYESEYQAWADQLTSYDGEAIRYDASGNPTTYRGYTMAWQGRRLTGATNGTNTISYSYDENGIRTQKTVNGTVTNYNYHGSALISQVTGNDTLLFSYDAAGNAAAVNYNGTYYYYVRNGQNDIIRLIDGENNTVVEYAYDSWGTPLSTTGTLASTLGAQNPFRYRGYVYDAETGLYYLQTRYYDPEVSRFINADNQLSTGSDLTGLNLFAYCGNNPVNRIDPTGEAWWHWALGAAVVAVVAVATVVTCGGFAAAATAVCMVGSGVAAATTASTVAAGAFIGSATVYGMAVLSAASTSNSVQEFNDQGNWGTVAATAFGGLTGGYDGYTMSKAQTPTSTPTNTSRGSTGRTEPANLREKLAMEQVKSNPSAGTPLTKITLNDPRWPSSEGWVKMQQIVPTSQGNINIHYVYNQTLKIFDDFKFKP